MDSFSTHPSPRSRLLRLAGTLPALALLIYLLSVQGWQEIAAAVQQIAPWRLALAGTLMLASRLAVTARWHVLLRAGHLPITFRQTLRLNFAGLFASNFLPTTIGGDLVRLVGALQLKFDPVVGASSLLVDRLVGMAGMALAVPLSLPVILGGSAATASTALSIAGIFNNLLEYIFRLARRVYDALRIWLNQPGALLLSLALTSVHMLCLFSLIYVLLEGMGETMPLRLIGGLYSLVYFVTLLPISFNGYGVQEISMTLIFTNLGRAPQSVGLTIALLFRTIMMLASLPGALALPDILAAVRERRASEARPE